MTTKWFGSARFNGTGSINAAARQREKAQALFAGLAYLTATANYRRASATFGGSGSLLATASLVKIAARATFGGSGTLAISFAFASLGGSGSLSVFASLIGATARATLSGSGSLLAVPRSNRIAAVTFAGTTTLSAFLYKFAHANFAGSGAVVVSSRLRFSISARLIGSGHLNAVLRSPRLTASARFVGSGQLVPRSDLPAMVLSTASTVRMSFPTFPNPSDPFMRRPSKDYNNYAISVRFTGSGRITAIAS